MTERNRAPLLRRDYMECCRSNKNRFSLRMMVFDQRTTTGRSPDEWNCHSCLRTYQGTCWRTSTIDRRWPVGVALPDHLACVGWAFLSWDCEDARMFTVMGLARDTTVSGVRRGWIVRLARGQRIAQVGRSVLGGTSQDCQHESTRLRISTSDVDT